MGKVTINTTAAQDEALAIQLKVDGTPGRTIDELAELTFAPVLESLVERFSTEKKQEIFEKFVAADSATQDQVKSILGLAEVADPVLVADPVVAAEVLNP